MRGLTRRLMSLAAACAMTTALLSAPALALEQIKMSIFQSNFCCFPVYVAKHLKLFEKHGVDVELVYGTGIQPANIFVSGSAESGAFAVEHGVTVSSKGQDLKLLVLEQQLPPLSLIVHNDVPTPNAEKPYPQNLIDLKGLKIGISGRGASTDTATRFMLKQAGLDPDKDVTIMPVGDPGTMLASLKNKVIDAAMAVEAIVEACAVVNDPARMNDLMDVAANYMKGSDPEVVKAYLTKYRSNYGAIATRQGVDNVSAMLVAAKIIEKAVPYEQLVATGFMPPEAGAPTR